MAVLTGGGKKNEIGLVLSGSGRACTAAETHVAHKIAETSQCGARFLTGAGGPSVGLTEDTGA